MEGYKKTELGWIPEDWEVKEVGEVFTYLNTATYSRADLSEKGEYKYIHYGDIHVKFNHFIDLKKDNLPTIEEFKAKKYPLLKNGDLVMADASEDYEGVGKSVELINIEYAKVIAGLHTILLRDNSKTFAQGYKGYIFNNLSVKRNLERLATGLKVYSVTKTMLRDFKIPIPTLAEQTAIATALSDVDNLIATLERKIEKKRNIKQGAMHQLLTGK